MATCSELGIRYLCFLKYLIHMKLSTFCILCCLSTSLSQAATYIWSGAAENGIYGDANNWTVNGTPNGYYPQSNSDNAIIGKMPERSPGPPPNPISGPPDKSS